ncbi:unnamed protein product [Hanseniaspora opuntiae]
MEYSESFLKHKSFMRLLTLVAQEILKEGKEMPIVTLLVFQDKIISLKYNKTNEDKNGIHHGEYLSFKDLPDGFLEKHKEDITLYVNVEPCIMCDGMIKLVGLKNVVFSCENERFGSSLLPESVKNTNKVAMIPFIYRKEAIVTLRQFYLQENKNAPKTRRKEGRSLDIETFPSIQWSSYFKDFDNFYRTIFDTKNMDRLLAEKIYNNNSDLETLDSTLIHPVNEPLVQGIIDDIKAFWEAWREPKRNKISSNSNSL